jgi:hypothetical protein
MVKPCWDVICSSPGTVAAVDGATLPGCDSPSPGAVAADDGETFVGAQDYD